jgi:hypothetical protein
MKLRIGILTLMLLTVGIVGAGTLGAQEDVPVEEAGSTTQ